MIQVFKILINIQLNVVFIQLIFRSVRMCVRACVCVILLCNTSDHILCGVPNNSLSIRQYINKLVIHC